MMDFTSTSRGLLLCVYIGLDSNKSVIISVKWKYKLALLAQINVILPKSLQQGWRVKYHHHHSHNGQKSDNNKQVGKYNYSNITSFEHHTM